MKTPKYYISLKKAYQEDGNWYVKGVASGTKIDDAEEKMSLDVLKKFASYMPMPLTRNHPKAGDIAPELGNVISGVVTENGGDYDLEITAELDKEHPEVPYIVKQIQKGKRYAFSIEGREPKKRTVWDDRIKKFITEYTDVIPDSISITTEPSYTPSFLEFVVKTSKLDKTETSINNQDITLEQNKMKKEEAKTETVEESKTEVKQPVVEETKVETPVEEPKAEVEAEVVEKVEEEPVDENLEKSSVEKACGDKVKKEGIGDILEMLMEMKKSLDGLSKKYEGVNKSVGEQEKVIKSFHEDIETLKTLPLQKRSKVSSVSLEERKDEPKTITDIVNNLLS